jgi:hypothetical protein
MAPVFALAELRRGWQLPSGIHNAREDIYLTFGLDRCVIVRLREHGFEAIE